MPKPYFNDTVLEPGLVGVRDKRKTQYSLLVNIEFSF